MNRWMTRLLVGACVCAAACGNGTVAQGSNQPVDSVQSGGNDPSTQGGSNDPGAPGGNNDPGAGSGGATSNAKFELRLLGVDAGALTSVRLRVKSVEIRAGATVLASEGT